MCYYVANHFFFAETLKWVLQKRKWSKQKSTQRQSNKSAKAQNTDPSPLTPPPHTHNRKSSAKVLTCLLQSRRKVWPQILKVLSIVICHSKHNSALTFVNFC